MNNDTSGSQQGAEVVAQPYLRPRVLDLVTAIAAVFTCLAVGATAVMLSFAYFAVGAGLEDLQNSDTEPLTTAVRQGGCLAYFDFVLERASSGLTAEQIERVVNLAQGPNAEGTSIMDVCGHPSVVMAAAS